MAEYICVNGILRPITGIYQCVDRLIEGVDYEFVKGLLVNNYNLITIAPNYPIEINVTPYKDYQNVVVCENTGVFFIQNYSSSYKYWQFWNGSSAITYNAIKSGINTFILNESNFSINGVSRTYSKWNSTRKLIFNTNRNDAPKTAKIVFNSIKSATMNLRPIRLLRDVSEKHISNKQPKSAESLGLLDVNSQILYFGSGSSIEVYND